MTIDIRDLITPDVAMALIPAFASSYSMADSISESIDFLGQWELKSQILPHLKNWAVEYELHRRAKEGILPFECSIVHNSRKNHKHIELRKNGFILTVSQTHNIVSMPRSCVFRNEHCMDGQLALAGFESGDIISGKDVYAILTHGGGLAEPSFILCGIPAPNMSSWSQHINLFDVVKGLRVVDHSPVTEDIKLDYRRKVQELVREKEV